MNEHDLLPVMAAVHNYFETARAEGAFPVRSGVIGCPFTPGPGRYLLLRGAGQEDRLIGPDELIPGPDRVIRCRIWLLEPPGEFRALCERIAAFRETRVPGAPAREQLEGYSLVRDERSRDWRQAFREDLAPWLRMASEVY